ncbi:MAG: OmpA family protein [Bacteroidota bacterium]
MKSKILLLIFAIGSLSLSAQERLADKFFKNYGYIKAAELYKEVLKKGDTSINVLTRLGDCYYNNSNPKEAAIWYGLAFETYDNEDISPEYMFKYVQSLRSKNDFEKANDWMEKFMTANNNSGFEDFDTASIEKFQKLEDSEKNRIVKLVNLPFNSKFADFGPFIYNDLLYFTSARNEDGKIYGWNKEPFLDIYQVDFKKDIDNPEYGNPIEVNADGINTRYHEASLTITNDGKTMYFTRDNLDGKRLDYDKEGTTHLSIYQARFIDGVWTDVYQLPFNDDFYSSGHPALSPDNKKLYFVSDREGGFGGTDIYVVDIEENGKFSKPRNLGDKVNTPGREMFPFVAKDNTLFFSSDGHINLGLLDIFKSDILNDENAEPQNLGAPYNSGYDDFAYFNNATEEEMQAGFTGYFSSNRPEGKGSDDIYSFDSRVCEKVIKGVTRVTLDNSVLPGVKVQLINDVGVVIAEVTTGADGAFEFEAECESQYTLIGTIKDHRKDQKEILTDDSNDSNVPSDLFLEPLVNDNQIVINPIFFDYDKAKIRTDAKYELENIVDVLRAHPEMVIRIESHTDSRGRDLYNMKLSDKRAQATRDYLLSRNIAPERIESAIGFGESQLLNECANGVKCTEEQHQMNRRSYFYIVKE